MSEELAKVENVNEVEIPNLGSFEDHESAWKSAYGEMEDKAWRLAEVSASLVEHHEGGAVEQFAKQRGVTPNWIYQLGKAYRFRQTLPRQVREIRELPNGRPLTITHYVDTTFSPNPQRLMRRVIEESLSTGAIRKITREEKQAAVRSLPGEVKDLPESEKPARPVVVRNHNATGTMDNKGIHQCEHCHSPLVRMGNLGKVMEELDLSVFDLHEESGVSTYVIEELLAGYEVSHPVAVPLIEVIRERRSARDRRREAMGL